MTLPTSANGWSLIQMPDPWCFSSQDWKLKVPSAINVSPFTQQTQVMKWPGADQMTVTCNLPPMTADTFQQWVSFVWACQGQTVAFMVGDPLRRKPRGNANTAVSVLGTNAAAQITLSLKGFAPNAHRLFLGGDLIQVNYRLYRIENAEVASDANGHATVVVCPSLRETLTDGMPVTYRDPQGMFRMVNSENGYSIGENHLYTMSFQATEAR